MYSQNLVRTIEPVKKTTLTRLNRSKKWKYGYNKENDIIVISKTGTIGEIVEIQNLKIALPKQPKAFISPFKLFIYIIFLYQLQTHIHC